MFRRSYVAARCVVREAGLERADLSCEPRGWTVVNPDYKVTGAAEANVVLGGVSDGVTGNGHPAAGKDSQGGSKSVGTDTKG